MPTETLASESSQVPQEGVSLRIHLGLALSEVEECNDQTLTAVQGRTVSPKKRDGVPLEVVGNDDPRYMLASPAHTGKTEFGLSFQSDKNGNPALHARDFHFFCSRQTKLLISYTISQVPPTHASSFFISVSS